MRRPVFKYNEAQQKAIDWGTDKVLVSAGPGSGKTRVIISRIKKLIDDGIKPTAILATTFTKKAADEMNDRLEVDGVNTDRMSVQTMHSFCYQILRDNGFDRWEVDDRDKYFTFLKKVVGFRGMKWNTCDISELQSFISEAKNALQRPDMIREWEPFSKAPYFGDPRYIEAYFHAEEMRASARLLTFDDMLIDGVELLQQSTNLRESVQSRYEYVIVDEYQDSNLAQVKLIELVAPPHWNLMCVGDVDQSIYEFRGAIPQYMVQFKELYKSAVISMGVNYRCAPNIVESAAKCIAHNKDRVTKDLTAHKEEDATIKYALAADLDDEAVIVADEIENLRSDGFPLGSIFVLYRTNAQSRAIEEVFQKRKLPYIVIGSVSFYQRKEVQDLLAYLKLVEDPKDVEAGERAINRPFRYIGKQVIEQIVDKAYREDITFLEAANLIRGVNPRTLDRIRDFDDTVSYIQKLHEANKADDISENERVTVGDLINRIVKETGYLEYLKQTEGSDSTENSREANVGELIRSAGRYKDIREFLDFIDMQIRERRKKRKNKNSVTCMTIHKAKGLEARAVFLIGVNEKILPHAFAEEPKEEERRLFYVGMTRAMEYLHVSSIGCLGFQGDESRPMETSRFVKEAGLEQYLVGKDLTQPAEEDNVPDSAGDWDADTKRV